MASISKDPKGNKTIQFVARDKKRRSIRLGKMSQRQAKAIKLKVEALNIALISKIPLDADTANWIASIEDELSEKLAKVGLIPARKSALLGLFTQEYIDSRTDLKPGTRKALHTARNRLIRYFGDDKELRSITQADADNWLIWLKREKYADGTVGRCIRHAKAFFKSAVRAELIKASPFAHIKTSSSVNEDRKTFVTIETINKVIDAAPDAEWRLIIALARFGGIRIPSELLTLKWENVNWEQERFLVISPKTEHINGRGSRWVPIFPELRPYLEEAFESAEEGAVFVINRYRNANANLRTQLLRICKRAGVDAWPKLFVNLRSSRETELANFYPLHQVCAWIGNTTLVAQKHYLQVRDDDYQQAAKQWTTSAAKSGAQAVQNPVQSAHATDGQQLTEKKQSVDYKRFRQILSTVVNYCQNEQVGREGFEPPTKGL